MGVAGASDGTAAHAPARHARSIPHQSTRPGGDSARAHPWTQRARGAGIVAVFGVKPAAHGVKPAAHLLRQAIDLSDARKQRCRRRYKGAGGWAALPGSRAASSAKRRAMAHAQHPGFTAGVDGTRRVPAGAPVEAQKSDVAIGLEVQVQLAFAARVAA